ncbi:MAG: hypothetical protein AAFX06_29800 [Planctomycetota bacterium]
MTHLPFPTNENVAAKEPKPWSTAKPCEPLPIAIEFVFCDGRSRSFAVCDIREWYRRDAGYIQLSIFGFEKYRVTIEGRHLDELYSLLQRGRVKALRELGSRTFDLAEESPSIDTIKVEALTGPPN